MTEGRKRKLSDLLPSDPPPYGQEPRNTAAASQESPNTPTICASDNDENAVSAAEVLANLAHLPGPEGEGESSVALPMSLTSLADLERQQHPIVLGVSAVSKHPIVSNAIKYYEDSKRSYAPLNYAAGIVEKAALPVFSKIEVNLNSMHQAKLHEARREKKRRVTPTEKTETKKRLKFCLHILKLANRQINDRVNCLQRAISDTDRHQEQLSTPQLEEKHDDTQTYTWLESQPESRLDTELTAVSLNRLELANPQETQTEIVTTVKKIIHVISNFRPSSLVADNGPGEGPESEDYRLKSTIREIILNLPNQVQHSSSSPQTNDKIVNFAKESLNMIGRLTLVFNNQLEKAESWVDGDEEGEVQLQLQQLQHLLTDEKAQLKTHGDTAPALSENLKH